ncbi:MAG: aldo/keto reductase [Caldilineaceae bacterium]|nr:aldo/keto reductase [Caldilineaceae bacterium]
MKYTTLADTGEKVSELNLGTMMFGGRCDEAEADRILGLAIERGVNFIDTAAGYGNGLTEEILGRIMQGGRREKLFVTTKVNKGVDRASILSSLDESLQRMQTDYVDLYLIHWPVEGMNPTEIMGALHTVVASGKTRYVGCCNFPAWLLAHHNAIAAANGWPRLVNNQIAYNIIERGVEVEIFPQAVTEQIAITAYRSLVQGLLTGKYRWGHPLPENTRGQTSAQIITWLSQFGESVDRFITFAQERDITPATLAIAWVRHAQAVTAPIIGVSSLPQLEEALESFAYELSDDDYAQVTHLFDTEVKEEGLQRFPGLKYNFPRLRRNLNLVQK